MIRPVSFVCLVLFHSQISVAVNQNDAPGDNKAACNVEENTDYPGLDLNLDTGRTEDRRNSAMDCRELCNENPKCNFFGWKSWSRECWMKTGISRRRRETGTTSGSACRKGQAVEKCCSSKSVGGVQYLLVSEGAVLPSCLSDCIYQRSDNPAGRYCFARGNLPVTCEGPPIISCNDISPSDCFFSKVDSITGATSSVNSISITDRNTTVKLRPRAEGQGPCCMTIVAIGGGAGGASNNGDPNGGGGGSGNVKTTRVEVTDKSILAVLTGASAKGGAEKSGGFSSVSLNDYLVIKALGGGGAHGSKGGNGYGGGGGYGGWGGAGGFDGANGRDGSNTWGGKGGTGSGVNVSTIMVSKEIILSPGAVQPGHGPRQGGGGGGVLVNNDGPVDGNNGKGYGGGGGRGAIGHSGIVILAFNKN